MASNTRATTIDMLNGPLGVKIVQFAIPLALASLFQQLFNSADAAFAGQFVGASALAAIGGLGPVIALFVGLFLGLSIGGNVTIAMRIGQGDRAHITSALHTSATVALVGSVIITAFGLLAVEPILDLIDMPADSRLEAAQYLRIYFGGICFFIVYDFAAAALRAKGDTRRPLYALIAGSLLNVALNYGAVQLGLGVAGIALATVAANALAASILIWVLMHEEEPFRFDPRALTIEGQALRSVLSIGIPSGIQGMVFSLSNVVIQSAINGFGTSAMAGSAAEVNFESYSYFFINAFSQAAVTFVGQNFAAQKYQRCDTAVRHCVLMALGVSLVLDVAVVLLGDVALGIFTTDADALAYGRLRLSHVLILHWLMAFIEVPASGARGMGSALLPAIVVTLGTCVLRVAYIFWLFPVWGTFESLIAIYPVSWVLTGATMVALFFFVRKQSYPSDDARLGVAAAPAVEEELEPAE